MGMQDDSTNLQYLFEESINKYYNYRKYNSLSLLAEVCPPAVFRTIEVKCYKFYARNEKTAWR